MTLSTLDPTSALVVIDLQKGVVSLPTAHDMGAVVANAAKLARGFRDKGLPVVLVNATGVAPGRTEAPRRLDNMPPDWADLVPDLGHKPGDLLVSKQTWGAFMQTDLAAQLRDRGVTQVVLAGVATSAGVESTARQAHELGFNVTLAIDAMTDMNADAHDNSVQRIFPRLGETGTTEAVLALLGATGA